MGFHSWDCRGCGHPALSHYVTNNRNAWMRFIVAVRHDGTKVRGEYDGYGRVVDEAGEGVGVMLWEGNEGEPSRWKEPDVWHEACWKAAGKPAAYMGGSQSSRDQGFFYRDGSHDADPPVEEVE